MANTVVHLAADTVEVDHQPRYRLQAHCTDQGDLQDTAMFLLEIVDAEVPGDDTFTRVLNVTDLDSEVGFPNKRSTAIAAGKNFYRSAEVIKYFDDVEVAASAKQVLQDEINRYVNEYVTYSTQYATLITGEDVSFPTAEESTADALKTAYDTALTAYNTALTAQQTASVALADAEDEYAEAVLWQEKYDLLYGDLSVSTSEMIQAKGLYAAFLTTATGFHTEVKAFIDDYDVEYPVGTTNPLDTARDELEIAAQAFWSSITAALSAEINGTIQTGVTNHTNKANNPGQYYLQQPSVAGDLSTKQNTVTTTKTAKVIADADVTAKYNLVEAAYRAAKAVCPDWTPDTPLPARPST